MTISALVLLFMGMLLAALLLEPVARLLRLPVSAALVAGGFAGSEIIVGMGIDTGLRWHHFRDLVFFVFLPALIFQSAYGMSSRLLLHNLVPILLLALPVLLLSTLLTAALVFAGIAHPEGFPWITALVCGALLSATDPVAVTEVARRLPVPERLVTLMEGESLFNDATTIVLFTLLLAMAITPGTGPDWSDAGTEFLKLMAGGAVVGAVGGLLAALLIGWLRRAPVVSLMAAYASYLIAETWFEVSGIMACLACGLLIGQRIRSAGRQPLAALDAWWAELGWIANSGLYLLAGATITLGMFEQRWLAMLIGVAAVLTARFIGVWLTGWLTSLIPAQEPVSPAHRLVMSIGGVRGAVTLALALSLPVELEAWWTVQSIAYGVVVFSLFVQAPLVGPVLAKLQREGRL
jgi:CPA1 family monovalent cation:H+ antiporter